MRWPGMSRTVLALLLGCPGHDDSGPSDTAGRDTGEARLARLVEGSDAPRGD